MLYEFINVYNSIFKYMWSGYQNMIFHISFNVVMKHNKKLFVY